MAQDRIRFGATFHRLLPTIFDLCKRRRPTPPLKSATPLVSPRSSSRRARHDTGASRESATARGAMLMGVAVAYAAMAVVALRLALSHKSALYAVRRLWRWADEWAQAYQYHEVPRFACDGAENPLFRKAAQYVAALPSLEDADAASVLSSSSRTNGGFSLQLGPGHTARDAFLGARLAWTNREEDGREVLVLRVRRHDRTRVLRPYLQHVESVADEMELRRRELRLFANTGVDGSTGTPRWASAPFTHPATLDTVAMDPDLKARVRADLENFLKGRAYYHRLGRVWRRSYLLYGLPGTGKSTFAAAMARLLGYDIYDIDLSRAGSDDLRALLLHTTPRSLILVEDLDRFLQGGGDAEARAARVLSFMDGVASCCGEERVMVFTMRGGKEGVDAAVVRPGRLDVHIQFTLCDFEAFKALASNYLGLKDHKLYPQVEESFHSGARLSPAELGEIMLANRSSPSRALRNVITKLQHVSGAAAPPRPPHRRNTSWSGAGGPWDEQSARTSADTADAGEEAVTAPAACGVFAKDAPMREFKKLYGLIKIRSRKEAAGFMPLQDGETPAPANGRGSELDKER
ncbi:AAA-ATPase At2g46620 [Oryza brachyantha]|uniref:AAA-ATPase At2g46620 n=1 Tax=Oryza brachyantha TaxID=4533 RepID=UPI001ADB1861|nr:AAA-ATPase At2g46620 [Oryza brachyantha]